MAVGTDDTDELGYVVSLTSDDRVGSVDFSPDLQALASFPPR